MNEVSLVQILTLALGSQVAAAQTVLDAPKEVAAIEEREDKGINRDEAPSHGLSGYKPGKGFSFTSGDSRFNLTIGGYMQPRYSFAQRDDDNPTPTRRLDISEFRVRRAKLVLTGFAFSKNLTYKLQVELTQGGSQRLLEDVWSNYKVVDELQLRAGQDKVPFSRQWLVSAWALSFIERSSASDAFYAGRDFGAMVNGKLFNGIIAYTGGAFGGAGQSLLNTDPSNALAGRLVFNPFGEVPYVEADIDMSKKPRVALGGDYYHRTFRRSTASGSTAGFVTTNVQFVANTILFASPVVPNGWLGRVSEKFLPAEHVAVDTWSIDLAFKWMGIAAQSELYYGRASGKTSGRINRARAFYAQLGYMLVPRHLELAGRYSVVQFDKSLSNATRTDLQALAAYYFENHYLKLQAEFTNVHDASMNGTNDQIYQIQLQLMF